MFLLIVQLVIALVVPAALSAIANVQMLPLCQPPSYPC